MGEGGVHCQRDSYCFLSLKSIVLALRRGEGGVKRQFLRYVLIESSQRIYTYAYIRIRIRSVRAPAAHILKLERYRDIRMMSCGMTLFGVFILRLQRSSPLQTVQESTKIGVLKKLVEVKSHSLARRYV